MIHLDAKTGKTVCGLLTRDAAFITDVPKSVTCPECQRVMHKRFEPVVKDYPPGAVAKSYAMKEKKE